MTFNRYEKEVLIEAFNRAICDSEDEIAGIESYLNYLHSNAVFEKEYSYTPEMQSDAIDCAQSHLEIANNEFDKFVQLRDRIIDEIKVNEDAE